MKRYQKLLAGGCVAGLMIAGTAITSFAAYRGTWRLENGDWYCYDSYGDLYRDVFCLSNGKEFYVGGDGRMVRSSWVEYQGDYYYVNSAGTKTLNDWRYTAPYDDEDGEPVWFYFQATGKMAVSKKLTYKGDTYFLDGDGRMLTGWVTADGSDIFPEDSGMDIEHTYFCDPEGAAVRSEWVLASAPGEDWESDDLYYYYMKSTGRPATGKYNNIRGQTYLFNPEGQMLSGWVGCRDGEYFIIDGEASDYVLTADAFDAVYYCGAPDDGHVKKNKWMELWRPADTYEEDWDVDGYWYWIESSGKVYIPTEDNAAYGSRYELGDGEMEYLGSTPAMEKRINSKTYFFNANGEMLCDFLLVTEAGEDLDTGLYYFGDKDDGEMKTGSKTVRDENGDSYRFYFGMENDPQTGEKKGAGFTGNHGNKLYYQGLLIQAEDYRYQTAEIDGHTFIVSQSGSIQRNDTEYKEDGEVLIDAKPQWAADGTDLYRIEFVTEENQWRYSIDEEASVGSLKDYTDGIDVTEVMSFETE
ncbi:MAG TPA: hypothetical protein IAB24_05515 [Candidatus Copromonas avistercoris]|nr:hypothetical protein [Candidatus Copromonas avistercoris]